MADLDFEHIIYEKKGPVAVLTINREGALNAIAGQTSREMQRAWEDFRDDDDLRVAILTGVGEKSFSTGMDLVATARGENQFAGKPAPFGGFTKRMPIFKPIIAAINGYCLAGGMELALTCDIRICTPDARFGLPELMDRAMAIANMICERGPLAVRAAKETIIRGMDMPLEHGLAYEDLVLGRLMATDDAKEGPKAFAEKRKPEYKGR